MKNSIKIERTENIRRQYKKWKKTHKCQSHRYWNVHDAFKVTLKLTHDIIDSGSPKILKLNQNYIGQHDKLRFLQNRK